MRPSLLRYLGAVLIVCLGLACAACSASPEDTVTDYYKAVSKGDIDKAVSCFSLSGAKAQEKQAVDAKIRLIVGEMKNAFDSQGGFDSVEISKVTEEGDKRVVEHTIKFKNGQSKKESMTLIEEDGKWKIHLR